MRSKPPQKSLSRKSNDLAEIPSDRILAKNMKPTIPLCLSACLGNLLLSSQAAPLATVENSSLSTPAASIAAAGIPGATNLSGSNFMLSAVAPLSSQGGRVSLASSQRWVNRYNDGPVSAQNSGNTIAVRADGAIVVTGSSGGPAYNYDFVTLCYAPDGTTLWTNRYDGPASGDDTAQLLATSPSGDVWVTGTSMREPNDFDLLDAAILRYSSTGTPVWTNRYTSLDTNSTYPLALAVDGSNNACLEVSDIYWPPSGGGGTIMEYALVKYDPLGNILWVKHYPASGQDSGEDLSQLGPIALDNAGNLFIAGTTGSFAAGSSGNYGMDTGASIVKLAADGSELWTNHLALSVMNLTRSLLADRTGDLILTGESPSTNGAPLYVVTKCSKDGVSLWTNLITGPNYDGGDVPQTVLDPIGNVFVTGGSPGTSPGFYQIFKFNSNGVPIWTNQNANLGSNGMIYASAVDSAGNLYLVGSAPSPVNGSSDFVTMKFSSDGRPQWTARFDGPAGLDDYPLGAAMDSSGSLYVTGESERSLGNFDLVTVKFADLIFYTPPRNFTGTDSISYTLADLFGNTATGSVPVVVAPGTFGFNPAATKPITGGNFQLQLTGVPGTNPVVLQTSTDLVHWQPILTNTPVAGSVQFLDSAAPGFPLRFYRAFQTE